MTDVATTTAQPDTGAVVATADAATTAQPGAEAVAAQAAAATTTDQNATTTTTENGKGADDKGKPAEGAPEAYTDFAFPEGVAADAELLGEFTTEAKALNLSQDKAQKLVDLGAKMLQKSNEAQRSAWDTQTRAWVDEVKADKELGGPNMAQNLAFVAKARDQFLDKDTVEFLNTTGLGNHPGLLRALHKIGKAMGEDKVLMGGQGGAPDPLATMYPTMVKK